MAKILLYRYVDADEIKTSYPIINLGNVEINKNEDENIELYVMDDYGNILDGKSGSETGSRILAVISAMHKVSKDDIGFNALVK